MKNELLTPAETAERIRAGAILSIAGPDALLATLPRGTWIGGTTVYMLTEDGGARIDDRLFVSTFDSATGATIRHHSPDTLPALAQDRPLGVTLLLIPAFSDAHRRFALDGTTYDGLFDQPLAGWITGVPVEKIGTTAPAIFDGTTGTRHTEGAMALHVALPAGTTPSLDIVNIFTPSDDPATTFTFPQTGFSARTATVNGKTVDLAAYLRAHAIDTRLPLVANYAGALINVSFEHVDAAGGGVSFYAPVIAGTEYRLATAQPDYAAAFAATLGDGGEGMLSCNCILNYLHGDMAGKKTGRFTGPVTFGEIAYILLNQTLVKLDLAA